MQLKATVKVLLSVWLMGFILSAVTTDVHSQDPTHQRIESDDPLVVHDGEWISQNASGASGGSYLYNAHPQTEAALTLSFSGTSLQVIYVSGPGLGTLAIEVDGTVLRTVITTADKISYGQSAAIDYLSDEAHTLRVYAQAGGVVGVDAFVILPLTNDVGVSAGVSRSACDNITRVQRASESSAGVEANYDSRLGLRPISNDGRYVVFETSASNLVANDTNNASDVFVRDRVTCTTTRASVASDGTQANSGSFWGAPSISSDGRYVVFTSAASNLVPNDTNGVDDVFLRDRQTNTTTRVSLSNTGQQLINASDDAMISGNGRYVVFLYGGSDAVSGDNNAEQDVFVRDLQLNTTVRVSITNSGNENDDFSSHPFISETGQFVTFSSGGTALVAGDTNAVPDIFMRDLVNNTTIRASVADDESEGNGQSGDYSPITPDGRYVMFSSIASNLVAGDNNGFADVFVRDLAATTTMRVSLSSSGGQSNGNSYTSSISDDGTLVAFLSGANNLVSGDTNQRDDLFVRNLSNQTTIATSRTFDGLLSQGVTTDGRMSPNGRYIVLINSDSLANLLMPLPIYHAYVNDLLLLYAPATLTATAVSDGQIALTWTDTQADETEYRIERSPDGTSNWVEIGTAPANTTTYTNVSLICNTPYFYRVRAYRASDMTYSAYSNVVNATTAACPTSCHPNDVTQLLSRAGNGTQGNNDSGYSFYVFAPLSISGNGRYTAFTSIASNLVDGDTNGWEDVFVVDRTTCQIWRVSVSSSGGEANYDSRRVAISDDGRYVAFQSRANNLVLNDTSPATSWNDIFLHDRETGQTSRISPSGVGDGRQENPTISGDGRYIAYESEAATIISTDTDTNWDIYRYDRVTNTTLLVSQSSTGIKSNGQSVSSSISNDGRYVAFQSDASNLVVGDTNLCLPSSSPCPDIFVRDIVIGTTTRVSVSSAGVQSNNYSSLPFVSGDGRFVTFLSFATNLVAGDVVSGPPTGAPRNYYRYDRQTGQTIRANPSVSGGEPNNSSYGLGSLSDDGRYMVWSSAATDVVAGDTNGQSDVFMRDFLANQTYLLSLTLGGGQANGGSYQAFISGDGNYMAFLSDAENLVASDSNGFDDAFVVAVQSRIANLNPPTTLTAVSLNSGQIRLNWVDASNSETNYRIERSPNGTSGWVEIGTAPANTTTYTNSSLICSTAHYYRVRAYRASDTSYSAYSNVADATTAACLPDALAIFNATTNTANLVKSLTNPPVASDYVYYTTGFPYGVGGQYVMGDWNGDGLDTMGVYLNGAFWYTNNYGQTGNWTGIWIGLVGRPAVAGRFAASAPNDCIGVVDSAEFPPYGTAFALYFTCNLTSGATPPLTFQWLSVVLPTNQGHSGTHQFGAGDYDGDGVDSIAIRRGNYIAWTNIPPTTLLSQFSLAQYIGAPGTGDEGQLVVGDWNLNNIDSFGLVYQNGRFYRRDDLTWNSGAYSLQQFTPLVGTPFGVTTWRPN